MQPYRPQQTECSTAYSQQPTNTNNVQQQCQPDMQHNRGHSQHQQHTPSQQNLGNNSGGQHCHQWHEPQFRTPHVELPLFHCENPRAWLLECEDLFNLVNIPVDGRVKWGIAHIRGQAKTWLNSAGLNANNTSWADLGQILLQRFPDAVTSDPMDQLQQLKQTSSVNAYIDAYEAWMTQMKRERSYLPQDFFVDRFISGLKEGIKHTVQCQKPETLLSAYWFARQYEKAYLSSSKTWTAPSSTTRHIPIQPNRPALVQAAPRDIQNKAPRKCWYCPENWTIGHRCQTMQRALNNIEMQGHYDNEQEQEDQFPREEPQDVAPDDGVHQGPMANPEQLMNISAAAYNGSPSESTISLLLNIQGSRAIALADTGSTNTFMDHAFAIKNEIKLIATKRRKVKVAGGGIISSEYVALECPFTIHGKKFSTDFRILNLQGSDVILGVNWFKCHNPVTFDFIGRSLTLGVNGELHTFSDHLIPKDKLLISSEQCSKLIEQGAEGYLLLPTDDQSESQPEEPHPPLADEFSNLLHQFQDIFQAPSGLPPRELVITIYH